MNKLVFFLFALCILSAKVYAHSPICDCYDNDDGSISCEGGFSDGGSAAGVEVHVVDQAGKVLLQGSMSEYSEFTFDKPDVDYWVQYLAGEGHTIEIDSRDIEF